MCHKLIKNNYYRLLKIILQHYGLELKNDGITKINNKWYY